MTKIAIVDDNQIDIERLEQCIDDYSKNNGLVLNVTSFRNPVAFMDAFSCNYDILFLDIEMPGINGIETARKIREKDNNVVIVFVTNLGKYAIEGYSVAATDFILKPVNNFSFNLKFARILSKIPEKDDDFLLIRTDGKTVKVAIKDIDYVEVYGHYLNYFVNGEELQEYNTLKSVEQKLIDSNFVRCHRSFLINLRKVKTITKNQVVVNGKYIQIARPQKKAFLEALSMFIGGK